MTLKFASVAALLAFSIPALAQEAPAIPDGQTQGPYAQPPAAMAAPTMAPPPAEVVPAVPPVATDVPPPPAGTNEMIAVSPLGVQNEVEATELLNEVFAQGFVQFRRFERTETGYIIEALHPERGWVTMELDALSGDIQVVAMAQQ